MTALPPILLKSLAALCAMALVAGSVSAADEKTKAGEAGAPTPEMMAQMMALGKPAENHKLLAEMVGDWSYAVKMWMEPGEKPSESTGTATRRAVMDGRFFIMDVSGAFEMPGADGKLQKMDFKGMAIEGYDNVKKKFVSTWIDTMSTGITMSEGTYDSAAKTFTFHSEYEPMPGMRTKVRELITIKDKDHHTMEWFEDRGGKEEKTMEIAYTRKK